MLRKMCGKRASRFVRILLLQFVNFGSESGTHITRSSQEHPHPFGGGKVVHSFVYVLLHYSRSRSIADHDFIAEIFVRLLPVVDSLGLNEQELAAFVAAKSGLFSHRSPIFFHTAHLVMSLNVLPCCHRSSCRAAGGCSSQ